MKVLLRVLLVVVIALVILVVGAYFYLDTITQRAITYSATRATGVETTLGSAHMGVFAGELTLDDLAVDNPQGFKADRFLTLDQGDVQVTLSSLMDNTVVIPRLHLDGLKLDLEYANGKANYQVILDNLQKLSGSEPTPSPKTQEPGKSFKINDARITGIQVHMRLVPPAGVAKTVEKTIKVGDIELGEIGTDTPHGVLLSRVSAIVLKAVIQKVVEDAGGELPTQILGGLKGGLGDLGNLRKGVGKMLENTTGKNLKEATKQAQQTGEAAKDAAKDVGRGLQNMFGGKTDKDESEGDGDQNK